MNFIKNLLVPFAADNVVAAVAVPDAFARVPSSHHAEAMAQPVLNQPGAFPVVLPRQPLPSSAVAACRPFAVAAAVGDGAFAWRQPLRLVAVVLVGCGFVVVHVRDPPGKYGFKIIK